jgi:sigma-E factor negative regulatory protein RseB
MTAARATHGAARIVRVVRRHALFCVLAALAVTPARAQEAAAWLARAAAAAKQLNYVGTIAFHLGDRAETSRIVHLSDKGSEFEKLTSLDGPAREVIRSNGEVRCYFPDARVVRVEPPSFRNAFPSLSPQQQATLVQFYDFRKGETTRVAGLEAQAVVFEPKDGFRYGHKFWADTQTGLLLKARLLNERGEAIEQFAFLDVHIGARIERDMVKPSWPPVPPNWEVKELDRGDTVTLDTGWSVTRLPPGFTKVVEGYRNLSSRKHRIVHLMFTDGLVAVSVFVEPAGASAHPSGLSQRGPLSVYTRQVDDYLVTVLGEAPGAAVRQIAQSVTRR